MLQQILADMYIDPDVLEALNEEQKKILFFKMREEQVRRWKEREEKEGKEGLKKERPHHKKGPCKSVSWLLGSDGDVHVCIIGESDDLKSPKLILSELRNKTATNPNNINRANAEPVKSSLTNRAPQTSTEAGIQLLLKKPEELSHSGAESDESKQDSGSDQSADEAKGQTDDSDSGIAEEDIGTYKSHFGSRATTLAESLNKLRLHRAMKDQLSITDKPHPLDMPYKGTVREKDSTMMYSGRVAQLRKTFNTTNANGSTPCVKPPIPSKPLHLLTSPSVR